MRDGDPNDHTDADYDAACVAKLNDLQQAVGPVISDLAEVVGRFARYDSRLQTAADCINAGETKRFTGVMCESFHDIWMELHEDLIVLQKISRAEEGSF